MRSIKLFREQAGLTQQELADLAGVHQHHISRWERGTVDIGDGNLAKVAKALGVTPWELRYGQHLLERREAVEQVVQGFALA